MTKKLEPLYTNCLECNRLLPENRYRLQRFCPGNICGVKWRTKNVYRYKYTHRHRSSSPRNFLKALLHKRNKDRTALDIDFLESLWNKQKGLCAISNSPMTYIAGKGRIGTNISLDQIDAGKGYTKDNVQLVTCDANRIKGILSMNELYKLCQDILNNRKDN